MTHATTFSYLGLFAASAVLCGCTTAPTAVSQAVNTFQNEQATGGMAMTVDVGTADISDNLEFPGFAFGTYDVDVSEDSLTMTLVADVSQLMVTQYDNTTFDRYYIAFDQEIKSAEVASTSDANFAANVEILEPGTTVTTDGTFVDGLASEFTFENGSILITIGEGTDLNEVQSGLTVNF